MNRSLAKLVKPVQITISHTQALVVLLLISYAALAVWLGVILKFNFMQSDVLSYWHNSIDWRTPFHLYHVPGYPLMVAMARGLTGWTGLGQLPPLALMMGVNVIALIASAVLTLRILVFTITPQVSQAGGDYALAGAVLFSLFPFVGVVNAVYPIADLPAMAFFLAGFYALLRSKVKIAFALLGLSLLTHKGIWIFVALIVIAYFIQVRPRLGWNIIVAFLLLAAPLALLWMFGSFHHGTPTWIFTTDLGEKTEGMQRLPLLDGLIGTIRLGGIRALVKGGALYAVVLGAVGLMWISLHDRPPYFIYGAAISAAVIISGIIINTALAWAVVRFGRLNVLPLAWIAASKRGTLSGWKPSGRAGAIGWSGAVIGLILLVASQFAFAWYMAAMYYE